MSHLKNISSFAGHVEETGYLILYEITTAKIPHHLCEKCENHCIKTFMRQVQKRGLSQGGKTDR